MTTQFFGNTAALTGRSLRHITRSLDTIITTVLTPIAIMLLFVYVFGGAISTGSKYINFMLPGILLITIASGISYTAFRLFMDLKSGILERFQSMPIARSGLLWAHVVTSMVAPAGLLAVKLERHSSRNVGTLIDAFGSPVVLMSAIQIFVAPSLSSSSTALAASARSHFHTTCLSAASHVFASAFFVLSCSSA